jgi:hypothetical protein
MKYYTYVWTFPDDTVAYVGKGCGNRDLGAKNESFEACKQWVTLVCRRVSYFETTVAAETHESQLIREFNPAFNRTQGRTPGKWVDGGEVIVMDCHETRMHSARGARSFTPPSATTAFLDALGEMEGEETILFVGDRFSGMLAEFLARNPNHTGKILTVEKYEAEHYSALGRAMEGHEGSNIEPENVDFLTTEFERVDYVIMNPPFSDTGSGNRKLWARFMDKAMLLAKRGVYMLVPKRSTIGLEHTILVDHVEFESTPVFGKAIHIVPGAKHLVVKQEVCKFDVNIHISHWYQTGRTAAPQGPFIGISRNKKLGDLSIRYEASVEDASIWVLQGKDLAELARLMEEKQFGAMFKQFQTDKAKELGHAPSINKSELVQLLNQL